MAKYCCICKRPLTNEEAPILTMGAYGSPKCICEECEQIADTATKSKDPEQIKEACEKLGSALTKGDTGDIKVIDTVNQMIAYSTERAKMILDGSYDFSLDDEKENEDQFDITEDLEETEEDKAKDEKDAKTMRIIDTVTSWISALALVGAVVFFLIKILR